MLNIDDSCDFAADTYGKPSGGAMPRHIFVSLVTPSVRSYDYWHDWILSKVLCIDWGSLLSST